MSCNSTVTFTPNSSFLCTYEKYGWWFCWTIDDRNAYKSQYHVGPMSTTADQRHNVRIAKQTGDVSDFLVCLYI